MARTQSFRVHGQVRGKDSGKGVSGLQVEVLDKDFLYDDRLGLVVTDENGRFDLQYDAADFQEAFFDAKPDLYLRVRTAQGHLITTTEDAVRYDAASTEEFIIEIPDSIVDMSETEFLQPLGEFQVIGEAGETPTISGQVNAAEVYPRGPGGPRLYTANIGLCRPDSREVKLVGRVEEELLELKEVMPKFRTATVRPWKQLGAPSSLDARPSREAHLCRRS